MRRKYVTKAERLAARRLADAARYRENRESILARRRSNYGAAIRGPYEKLHVVEDIADPRPPKCVILERDYRYEMAGLDRRAIITGDPPLGYASAYPTWAIRYQRMFELDARPAG